MRLLIAESSGMYARVLAQHLEEDAQVLVCCDGAQTLEQLSYFRPDILVINLQLPLKDGFAVLRQTAYVPPVILATSAYVSNHILRLAYALGVSRMLVLPAVNCLVGALQELITAQNQPDRIPDLREQTRAHLNNLNFRSHLVGSRELAVAIPMYAAHPEQKLAAELYPAVAEAMDISDGRAVERGIRTAIADAFRRRDPAVWEQYFPDTSACPNVKRFITRIVEMMEQ